MIAPNFLQEFLKWMNGSDLINIFIGNRKQCREIIKQADLIVLLDFNHSNRLGESEEDVKASVAKKVLIDHHLDPEYFTDIVISDATKCSTAELVHELVCGINGNDAFQDKSYAEALYVGIITDTGNFEHGSYSSQGLSELLRSFLNQALRRRRYWIVFTTISLPTE